MAVSDSSTERSGEKVGVGGSVVAGVINLGYQWGERTMGMGRSVSLDIMKSSGLLSISTAGGKI